MELDIKNITIYIISTVKINYLGINLTKHVQDIYRENYKILIKDIKEELNKWMYHVHEQEDSILSKCQFSSNLPMYSTQS